MSGERVNLNLNYSKTTCAASRDSRLTVNGVYACLAVELAHNPE